MGRLRLGAWRGGCFGIVIFLRQTIDFIATGLDQLTQVPRALPAEEVTLGALRLQGIGEGQAAHDVAAADLQRGVSAEGDHLPLKLEGYRRFAHAPPPCRWACQAL